MAIGVSDAGHIATKVAAATDSAMVMSTAVVPITVMVMMIGMIPAPVVGPIGIVPIGVMIPRITPVGVRIPGVAPIGIPAPIGPPIRTIAISYVERGVIIPIEGIVTVHINIGVTVAASVGVVVVIVVP